MPRSAAPATPEKKPYSVALTDSSTPSLTPSSHRAARTIKRYVFEPSPIDGEVVTPGGSSASDDDGGSVYSFTHNDLGVKMEIDDEGDEEVDVKPGRGNGRKVNGAGGNKRGGQKGKRAVVGSSGKAGKTWSSDEDWILFQHLHPKAKPDWADLARAIGNGRDAKSCQNRYALMSKRLEGAIKGLSGGK